MKQSAVSKTSLQCVTTNIKGYRNAAKRFHRFTFRSVILFNIPTLYHTIKAERSALAQWNIRIVTRIVMSISEI